MDPICFYTSVTLLCGTCGRSQRTYSPPIRYCIHACTGLLHVPLMISLILSNFSFLLETIIWTFHFPRKRPQRRRTPYWYMYRVWVLHACSSTSMLVRRFLDLRFFGPVVLPVAPSVVASSSREAVSFYLWVAGILKPIRSGDSHGTSTSNRINHDRRGPTSTTCLSAWVLL